VSGAAHADEAGARISARVVAVVFVPFAAGYFLSYFFRNVNAVIAKDLAREFALSPADLGLLTSAYFLAFGLFQLPLGVLLDRYGPRRMVASLLCVTALGAAVFGLADGFVTLALGRALIGVGVSACLMGSIKAFTLWFPLSRLATLNGWFIFLGAIGGLTATAPVEAALGTLSWRAVFYGMAAASLGVAALIALRVPEKPLPGAGETWRNQLRGSGRIMAMPLFWRIVTPFVITHGAYQALQGLWLGPWLTDVGGFGRETAARLLLVTAASYAVGSVFFGSFADRLAVRGVSTLAIYKFGLLVSFALFLCIALDLSLPRAAVLGLYGFSVMAGALAFALIPPHFPREMSGRAITMVNFAMFNASFAFQWGIGAVLRAYPVVDGRYAPEGYAAALLAIAALQVVVLAWVLPLRDTAAPGRS
jgi:predicted MFS family arabinose efflux permease